MFIWNDMSYINNKLAVEHGYAKIDVHGLRLSCHNADMLADAVYTNDGKPLLRGYTRDVDRQEMESRIRAVCDALDARFDVHQYTKNGMEHYKSRWDLFFWCNDKYNTTGGKECGRDFSYVTLGFNDCNMTYDERQEVCKEVIAFIETIGVDIDIAVQHDLHWDTERVKADVTAFCENYCSEKKPYFFRYKNRIGKIRKLGGGGFGFFEKGAKSRG